MTALPDQPYLRGFFDNLATGVLIADDSARYVDANRAACALLERPLESIVGQHVSDIVAPERAAEVDAQWQAFLRDGSQSGLFTIVLSDGTARQIDFQAHANFVPGLHCSFVRPASAAAVSQDSNQEVLALCAWTKRVRHEGTWIPVEEYLLAAHGLFVTHSISPEAFSRMAIPQDES